MTVSREKELKMKNNNVILANAFSVQMLSLSDLIWGTSVTFTTLSPDEARSILLDGFTSAIGHADTAQVVSNILHMDVPANRISISLESGKDTLIIAQVMGGRLPEGATILPDGMRIDFIKVEVLDLNN